jgi:hypothetical protein
VLPSAPEDVRLWHLTHVRNLPSIIASGALFPFSGADAAPTVDIARADIRQQRSLTPVPAFGDRRITDFVPFYLGPRPPMLLTIAQNARLRPARDTDRRPGYPGGQDSLVYLITTLGAVTESGLDWCLYDGHATDPFTRCLTGPAATSGIDWRVLAAPDVANSLADGDRKRRRSAEALVGPRLPASLILEIVARTDETASSAATAAPSPVPVTVNPDLYFDAREVRTASGERCTTCGSASRLAAARRTALEAAAAVQAHQFFEPATPAFCSDIARVLRVIISALKLRTPSASTAAEEARWHASGNCPWSVPADDLRVHADDAARTLSPDTEVRAAVGLAELLLAPFAGSPHGLRLVTDLLGHLSPGQALRDTAGTWASQASGDTALAHRRIVADHVTRICQKLSAT